MTDTTRRILTQSVVWTVPVVAVAATAPAFAASQPINCAPIAICKLPGEGTNSKDYVIRLNCMSTTPITGVDVFDNKENKWIAAIDNGDGAWIAPDFNDSRRDRVVRLTDKYGQSKTYTVAFSPC